MSPLAQSVKTFFDSLRNLLPVAAVMALFWGLVVGESPENPLLILVGVLMAAAGIALFLQGLESSVFPLGKTLSNEIAQKSSAFWLLAFGFCVGFAAVIAEPALILVSQQAQSISLGAIDALVLRLLVAVSVGLIVMLGVLRVVLGHTVRPYVMGGYALLIPITLLTPQEITGLAFDAGAVSANVVTVPLVTALGLGLAFSLRGRTAMMDGFGLVGLAVLAPRVVLQLYGLFVYGAQTGAEQFVAPAETTEPIYEAGPNAMDVLAQLLGVFQSVMPLVAVILFFQFVVIRSVLPHPKRVISGFFLLVLGLFVFVEGLKLGLFPVGEQMAFRLAQVETLWVVFLFVFLLGFAATLVEPALIAVARKAQEEAPDRINALVLRLLVSAGVGLGVVLGVARIVNGGSLDALLCACVALMLAVSFFSPGYIVALAYDLGGIATSDVTVPLLTAIGIGLATHLDTANPLIDGFGLVALASVMPIVVVQLYATAMQRQFQRKERV